MLPDGPPVLGASGVDGVWLNLGTAAAAGPVLRLGASARRRHRRSKNADRDRRARHRQAAGMNEVERIDSGIGRRRLFCVAATRRIEIGAAAGLPPYALMARAGEAAARLALALAPHAAHVRVYAGPGHNGGDGIEAAVRLREFGKHASVRLVDAAVEPPALVGEALARAARAGVPVQPSPPCGADEDEPPELVIDARAGSRCLAPRGRRDARGHRGDRGARRSRLARPGAGHAFRARPRPRPARSVRPACARTTR
jgi:hypothetical protein